jgi:hypothetical protein
MLGAFVVRVCNPWNCEGVFNKKTPVVFSLPRDRICCFTSVSACKFWAMGYFITVLVRAVRRSGNSLDWYLESAWFESLPGAPLVLRFFVIFLSPSILLGRDHFFSVRCHLSPYHSTLCSPYTRDRGSK